MKKTALITGASSGIGLELARIFAREGFSLILVARDAPKLRQARQELEKGAKPGFSVLVIAKDLSKRNSPKEIFSEVKRRKISVDVLVNNAGFGSYGSFSDAKLESELDMIEVNVSALAHLTGLFLPEMLKKKRGRILNVASTAAFFPGPLMAVYFATKAFVLSFSEALSEELRGTGVSVTALCPGPTRSGFQKAAHMEDSSLIKHRSIATSKDVAEYGFKSLMSGKAVAVHGLQNKLYVKAPRFLPRAAVRRLVLEMQKR